MNNTYLGLLVFMVALVSSTVVFPWALKFSVNHGIVDNPNARKLQRVPVPVFGGIVVYTGILMGSLTLLPFMQSEVLQWGIMAMSVMMVIGTWDDISDVSAVLRLFIEIAIICVFMAITGVYVDDFYGLWGIHQLDSWIGIPFSIFVGVGIINAINLIDGVDGYSSGYGMLACICLGVAFWSVWSQVMVFMAIIVIGALIPFFLHNVFGQNTRMFIGDGGTLMLGTLLSVMVLYSMSSLSRMEQLEDKGMCVVAFLLSVGCIPIFDTLRVMTMRIARGKSPLKPDKTHLHHLFIDMGFSHLGAALFILTINLFVVLAWLASWKLGASIDMQLYIVVALCFLVTFVFYLVMKSQQNGGPLDEEGYPQGTKIWHAMCKLGDLTHREDKRGWRIMRYIADRPMVGKIGLKK